MDDWMRSKRLIESLQKKKTDRQWDDSFAIKETNVGYQTANTPLTGAN
jgi:hypothetical protein